MVDRGVGRHAYAAHSGVFVRVNARPALDVRAMWRATWRASCARNTVGTQPEHIGSMKPRDNTPKTVD